MNKPNYNLTFASLFTGGGGADMGAEWAGLRAIWGIERDPRIAGVAQKNGLPVVVGDVLEADWTEYETPGLLWASPPCQSFSTAKQNGEETKEDLALAEAVASAILTLRPPTFCLENVMAYQASESLNRIQNALFLGGYKVDMRVVNAADFGVPQTRKRLILRASRVHDAMPCLVPTHAPQATLTEEKWVSWYEAIADLIPTLQKGKLANWQVEKLKAYEKLPKTFLVDGRDHRCPSVPHHAPGHTQTTNTPPSIVMLSHQTFGSPIKSSRPAKTVTVSDRASPLLIAGGNTSTARFRENIEPAPTVVASDRSYFRILENALVLKTDARCLARLQSFPDTYALEGTKSTLYKGIGNAVPPLLAQRVLESLL